MMICSLAGTLAAGSVTGQTKADYDAMRALLGEEKYALLQERDPEKAALTVYMNRHGYYLSDTGDKDVSGYPDISELAPLYPDASPPSIDHLEAGTWDLWGYNVFPDENKIMRYRIGDTGKMLTILSKNLAGKKMQKQTPTEE